MSDDLQAQLVAALAPPTIPSPDHDEGGAPEALEGFTIGDLDEAAWIMRRLAQREGRRAKVTETIAVERARLDLFEKEQCEKLDRDIRYYEGRLIEWHGLVLAEDPKAKTVKLPSGEVRSRAGALTVEVTDADAFVEWAELNNVADELVTYRTPDVDKKAVAERLSTKAEEKPGEYPAVNSDGEVVPGVRLVRKPRSHTVKADPE